MHHFGSGHSDQSDGASAGGCGRQTVCRIAIGDTIWEAPLRQFLGATLSDEGVIDAVAENYCAFVEAFVRGSEGMKTLRR
jgi:myo-inositol catabolism protein IolC